MTATPVPNGNVFIAGGDSTANWAGLMTTELYSNRRWIHGLSLERTLGHHEHH
jgi:hypothetical protein